jgi:biopolymer transport protein ExbD
MRRRSIQSNEEDSPEEPLVNLTPLIDVVFVVLISFMLLAPMLDLDSIQLAPGGETSKKEALQKESQLSISIRADNSIWFQGRPTNLKELAKVLSLEKKRRPNEIPQLIPDASSHFQTYQEVKNILESCGFEQLDIILRPP